VEVKIRRGSSLLLALLLTLATAVAQAETSNVSPSGFTITFAMAVDSEPERVYQAFTQLPRWWNKAHTWSGNEANLSLDAQAGGCLCERWGNGASAMHGQVLLALPGSALRLHAWLGPLQELPVQAVLTFGTARRDGATRLRVTYRVSGPADANLDKLAPAVDAVIGEQVKRLKSFIETGRVEETPPR
jgi:uncharacterized protein YndB with AHSA1/START domain